MSDINNIRTLIEQDNTDTAIAQLNSLIKENSNNDELFYLRGNAYRKQSKWKEAIENYLEAIAINPDSPAGEAKDMLIDILEFYNKDMYNQ